MENYTTNNETLDLVSLLVNQALNDANGPDAGKSRQQITPR